MKWTPRESAIESRSQLSFGVSDKWIYSGSHHQTRAVVGNPVAKRRIRRVQCGRRHWVLSAVPGKVPESRGSIHSSRTVQPLSMDEHRRAARNQRICAVVNPSTTGNAEPERWIVWNISGGNHCTRLSTLWHHIELLTSSYKLFWDEGQLIVREVLLLYRNLLTLSRTKNVVRLCYK